jgi:feruloyl esterase
VSATLTPSADSEIKIEVWMPTADWNGKFQAPGNGGLTGFFPYTGSAAIERDMASAIKRGYATASTDTGHTGNTLVAALGRPEKLIHFGYRAVHEMTVAAKAIVAAFYGRSPSYSYWNGCSSGGRQGLMEAQRFPTDYNGIIAGAPANPSTRLATWNVHVGKMTLGNESRIIPASKYPMIHQAVLNACDAIDGVKDSLIEDPSRCSFDFATLACKGEDSSSCLTKGQVESAKAITTPAIRPSTGETFFPGLAFGADLGWAIKAGGPEPSVLGTDVFKHVVFENREWDWRTFDLEQGIARVERLSATLDAVDPDLSAFHRAGGKLLLYHGWSDQNLSPTSTIAYFTRVVKRMGSADTANWTRLFLAPGMGHCGGGEGPNEFNPMSAIERWVEHGEAPDAIVATHRTAGKVDRTRPLCPYPRVAQHKGAGSIDDAVSFSCVVR